MADIAAELDQTRYEHPEARVYLADSLTDFRNDTGGTLEPYLYVEVLNLRCAPEIDACTLTYRVGPKINLGAVAFSPTLLLPSHFQDKAIKIVIQDTVDWKFDRSKDIVWFGQIDTITTEGVTIGQYAIQAVGVLQLADKQPIRSSYALNQHGTEVLQLGIGLPFNSDGSDFFGVYGNRSVAKQTDPVDHYVFAYEDRGREKWTTQTAVQYLLARHAPQNQAGTVTPPWVLDPETLAHPPGDWYDTQLSTDGKSLKQLLDELIPRKRAISYYVFYNDVIQKIVLRMFTFVAERIEVSEEFATPRYLEANPNQVQARLDESIWFTDDCKIVESVDAQYDAVVAYGERCTTTCTLTFGVNPVQFIGDWSGPDANAFKDAASTTDKAANARFRSEDRYAHVYRRFRISDDWDGRAKGFVSGDPPTSTYYWVDPLLDAAGAPRQPYSATSNPRGFPMRVRGLKLLSHLPLKDRVDYGGSNLTSLAVLHQIQASVTLGDGDSEYLAPLFFWHDGTADKYYLLDKISTSTEGLADTTKRRAWSVTVSGVENEPSVLLTHSNGRQSIIALADWTGVGGAFDATWDPVAKNGVNWRDFQATVCLQLEHRLTVRQQITAAPAGRPERILPVDAKDARLDYLVPKTIVGLNSGTPIYSDGGYVRDDRERVKALVKATAQWYGRPKRAVSFGYKQPRKLVEIGDLITLVDGIGLSTDINTPVTSITYTMGGDASGGVTKIETGFAEVDFA